MLAVALQNELQFLDSDGMKLDVIEIYVDTDSFDNIWVDNLQKLESIKLVGNKLIFSK
jgi:hypothetical protein